MGGEVRIPVSLKFDDGSSLWRDTVLELRSSRMLSTIILLLLELYHENDDIRQMIDSRAVIDSHVDFEALSKQLERISNSHKEALVATGLLRGTVSTSYSELDSKVSMLGTKLDAVLSVIQGLGGISFGSVAQVGRAALLGSGVGGSSTEGSNGVSAASGGSVSASTVSVGGSSTEGSGAVFAASGGISEGYFDGVSGGVSGGVSDDVSGGVFGDVSGDVSGAVSGVASGGTDDMVSYRQGGTGSAQEVDGSGVGGDEDEESDESDEGLDDSGFVPTSMQKLLGSLRK